MMVAKSDLRPRTIDELPGHNAGIPFYAGKSLLTVVSIS